MSGMWCKFYSVIHKNIQHSLFLCFQDRILMNFFSRQVVLIT